MPSRRCCPNQFTHTRATLPHRSMSSLVVLLAAVATSLPSSSSSSSSLSSSLSSSSLNASIHRRQARVLPVPALTDLIPRLEREALTTNTQTAASRHSSKSSLNQRIAASERTRIDPTSRMTVQGVFVEMDPNQFIFADVSRRQNSKPSGSVSASTSLLMDEDQNFVARFLQFAHSMSALPTAPSPTRPTSSSSRAPNPPILPSSPPPSRQPERPPVSSPTKTMPISTTFAPFTHSFTAVPSRAPIEPDGERPTPSPVVTTFTPTVGSPMTTPSLPINPDGAFVIVEANFTTGQDGFYYQDDSFRQTNNPDYAIGFYDERVGREGGSLKVMVGNMDSETVTGMSGAWFFDFALAQSSSVTLQFDYKVKFDPSYTVDQFSQVLVGIDDALIGLEGRDYIAEFTGGHGGVDTDWLTVAMTLGTIPSGSHRVALGVFGNLRTEPQQKTTFLLDNIRLLGQATGPPGSAPPVPATAVPHEPTIASPAASLTVAPNLAPFTTTPIATTLVPTVSAPISQHDETPEPSVVVGAPVAPIPVSTPASIMSESPTAMPLKGITAAPTSQDTLSAPTQAPIGQGGVHASFEPTLVPTVSAPISQHGETPEPSVVVGAPVAQLPVPTPASIMSETPTAMPFIGTTVAPTSQDTLPTPTQAPIGQGGLHASLEPTTIALLSDPPSSIPAVGPTLLITSAPSPSNVTGESSDIPSSILITPTPASRGTSTAPSLVDIGQGKQPSDAPTRSSGSATTPAPSRHQSDVPTQISTVKTTPAPSPLDVQQEQSDVPTQGSLGEATAAPSAVDILQTPSNVATTQRPTGEITPAPSPMHVEEEKSDVPTQSYVGETTSAPSSVDVQQEQSDTPSSAPAIPVTPEPTVSNGEPTGSPTDTSTAPVVKTEAPFGVSTLWPTLTGTGQVGSDIPTFPAPEPTIGMLPSSDLPTTLPPAIFSTTPDYSGSTAVPTPGTSQDPEPSSSATNAPTAGPADISDPPSRSLPLSRDEAILRKCGVTDTVRSAALLLAFSRISDGPLLGTDGTPQSLARRWIDQYDDLIVCPNESSTAIQRYAAAVVYYALDGPSWSNCASSIDGVDCVNGTRWLDDVHECEWFGVQCDPSIAPVGDNARPITVLRLKGNGLAGNLPIELFSFSELTGLSLDHNKAIVGTIPTEIADLTKLSYVEFDDNAMTGTLPEVLYNMTSLRALDLNTNNFTGTLSTQVSNLSRLVVLQVEYNNLGGSLPSDALGQLSDLVLLTTQGNSFNGTLQNVCFLIHERRIEYPAYLQFFTADCVQNPCPCCSQCF